MKHADKGATTAAAVDPHSEAKTSQSAKVIDSLVETMRSLSPSKQASVLDRWPQIEAQIDGGLTVSARSKKELRRLTRPQDPAMLDWLGTFEEGEVFYDVGANCGTVTLAAGAMHRERITIVAVEPAYTNFESLVRNLSRNGLLAFTIPLQVALKERTGIERLNYYGSTDAGTAFHAIGNPVDYEGNQFTPVEAQLMPAYALDDLIAVLKLPVPTRMKIDVDGHEGPLLRGAVDTLARGSINELAIEIVDHDRQGTRLDAVKDVLRRDAYELVDTFRHGGEGSYVSDHLFRRRGWKPGRQSGG
jgi:FkbM family methyltransferase